MIGAATTGSREARDGAPTRLPDATGCLSVAVVFATRGRPSVLAQVVELLANQRRSPDKVVVSCVTPTDVGSLLDAPHVDIVYGPPGAAQQRNTALEYLAGRFDVVVFFDDDFVPREDWLEAAVRVFENWPDVVALTGTVAQDGIKGPGLSVPYALSVLSRTVQTDQLDVRERAVPYGCNMAFRTAALAGMRFDPRLIRYSWLEDRDLGMALINRGLRSVQVSTAVGVHLGAKGARMPGRMLGYSQVINPLYLWRKGTMTAGEVAGHIGRNMASNLGRALVPEPWIDRRGRLLGNLAGLVDAARGRLDPERAERI